jgi:ubiquinone/menaquinone biosynthesis C-methylase UbiE
MKMKIAKIFDNANLYKIFQYSVSRRGTDKIIRDEILKPKNVDNVLDFGCGIGYHANEFLESNYLGIGPLQSCVDKANFMFSRSGAKFIAGDHNALRIVPDSSYDVIMAIGVLHHIDDLIFHEFLKESLRILKPGGRLTTFDPVLHDQQSLLSRWVVRRDRGQWVRKEGEYLSIVSTYFGQNLNSKIYSKLLRIPYDHLAIEAIKR